MRKIRLDLDKLSVETYETSSAETERGTVQGHWSQLGTCSPRVATCQVNGTCQWTCWYRCNDTSTCL